MACLASASELGWFLMCTLLLIQTVACLVTDCELVLFNVHCCGDTDVACLVLGGELAWFLISTLVGTQTVACLVSVGELVWSLICTVVVIQMWPVFFRR